MATRMSNAYQFLKHSLDYSAPAHRPSEPVPPSFEVLKSQRDEAMRNCQRYRDALQLIANIDPDELGVYRYIAKHALEGLD